MLHATKSSAALRVRTGPFSTPRRNAAMLSALAALSVFGGALLTGCGGGSGSSMPGNNQGSGTGAFTATFSNAAGTNANTAGFTATRVAALTSSAAFTLLNVTGFNISGANSRTFVVSLAESGPIQVGKTYTFVSPSASTLIYTESGAGTAYSWTATGGTAIVDSITGKNYKLRIVNATIAAGADNTSGATGSFTVNGNVDATVP